jgi:hypothetical protein
MDITVIIIFLVLSGICYAAYIANKKRFKQKNKQPTNKKSLPTTTRKVRGSPRRHK